MNPSRPWGIIIVAVLMILFGFAEIATGLTHNFLGLVSTTDATFATYGSATVGAFYIVGGVLFLTMKKQAARFAMAFLVLVVLGRIALVWTGAYPLTSFTQGAAIIIGTLIVIIFIVYVGFKWASFK